MTDWNDVMRGYGGARPDDNDMVQITKGTARLARAALHEQNEFDYYHNFGAAERELHDGDRRMEMTDIEQGPPVVEPTDYVGELNPPLFAIDSIGDYQAIRCTADGKIMLHDADRERVDALAKTLVGIDGPIPQEDRDRIDNLLKFLGQLALPALTK
jgi:hypothetical protein